MSDNDTVTVMMLRNCILHMLYKVGEIVTREIVYQGKETPSKRKCIVIYLFSNILVQLRSAMETEDRLKNSHIRKISEKMVIKNSHIKKISEKMVIRSLKIKNQSLRKIAISLKIKS